MQLIRGKKLKQIFLDHWPQFAKEHPALRPAIHKNVQKMLTCGTEAAGFSLPVPTVRRGETGRPYL